MTITIYYWGKESKQYVLTENQKIHITGNEIKIYHWNYTLDKPVTDKCIKIDIFHDSYIID